MALQLFLSVYITLFLAPVGIILAIYFDEGTGALPIASLTFFLILSGVYVYDRIIKRTFVIRIDEEKFYILDHRAKDEGASIKDIIFDGAKNNNGAVYLTGLNEPYRKLELRITSIIPL